ncbi:MAG TPA: hypothetical protein VNQ79_08540 [Blastocatellia bacterium]|nr:hypothetical protein [Blastocatellia bacterium]
MKIGILVGMENTFPPALIEKINSMNAGVTAEYLKIGGIKAEDQSSEYRLIFDRISHEIPYYRAFLKKAVLNGTIVVNNPFWWSADDKFFNYSLAVKLGVTVPKTVLLPQKSYIKGVTDASLRNLEFPLRWQEIVDYVGLPAILKPHDGGGWRDVYKVESLEHLWECYNRTGTLAMTLQEFIDFTEYVRCYCVGRRHVLVMPYDPKNRRYVPRDEAPLAPELEDRIIRETMLLNEALGYDLNTVEFAIKDGVPYAIDFMNPAPDADIYSVTEPYFNWVVNAVAEMLVDYAKNGEPTIRHHRWNRFLDNDAISATAAASGSGDGSATTNSAATRQETQEEPPVRVARSRMTAAARKTSARKKTSAARKKTTRTPRAKRPAVSDNNA